MSKKGIRPVFGSLWIISPIKQAPKYIDAAANTREVTSFLVWAKGQMQQLTRERLPRFQFGTQKKNKKLEKKNNKNQKKGKIQKIEKKNQKRKIVLDKMCVFCLYPIPDSQQCVKRGSCRHSILSGLLCSFKYRNVFYYYYYYLCLSYLFT